MTLRKSPRRILFIGGTSEPGGLHIHTVDVARALAVAGDRVAILNTSIDFFSQLVAGSAIAVETVPLPQEESRLACFRAWRRLLAPYGGWEMILCRGTAADTPLAALLAIRSRAQRIFTIEHRPVAPEVAARPGGFWQLLRGRLAAHLIRRAIAVSEETRLSAIAAGYLPPAKVLACLNWVDPAFFRTSETARQELRHHFGLPAEALVLGFAGRLAPDKRVDVLLDAFAALDPAAGLRLLLLGDGWKRTELEQQCKALAIDGRVTFAGWQADAPAGLAALDLFILPSMVEGFALSLLEAMAAGKLCLAHRMDSAMEAIVDGKSGLLGDFTTPGGMRAAIERALAMTVEDRQAMARAGAERAAARFARNLRLPAVLRALEADEAAVAARIAPLPSRRRFAFIG
jgi:glycosyltransferase involved in cell wall biosynthesis